MAVSTSEGHRSYFPPESRKKGVADLIIHIQFSKYKQHVNLLIS
uniref:Uncharacterized protein n=1 Tax=Arundo donax TaxID=35708 RepID=A0A0A8ZXA4_ARUDO